MTGCMRNMIDDGLIHERKWTFPFLEFTTYRRRRENFPAEDMTIVFIARELEKNGFSFDVYSP